VWTADVAKIVWMSALVPLGLPLVFRTIRNAMRGQFATDVIATLSIIASVALDQPLVGLVIVLMQSGGEALEEYAAGRASDAVRALESVAPRVARRLVAGRADEVPVDSIVVGDVLLVRPGDVVPCDGVVMAGHSQLDTSSLTGESTPVRAVAGLTVQSGSTNGSGSFELRVTAPAAESQYARIVEMVRLAQADKAPLQRLADKYAVWFTPFTLVLCAISYALSKDWDRVLAVLAVATPCPLILATPVAIIGGVNRAARRQVYVKSGGALERLSDVTVVIFDKTGTLTFGKPRIRTIHTTSSTDSQSLLLLAAAVEAHSSHLLARVIEQAAQESGSPVPESTENLETSGDGIVGLVNGQRVHVGSRTFVAAHCAPQQFDVQSLPIKAAALTAYVAVDGVLAGAIEFEDAPRTEVATVLHALREFGIQRVLLLSGDAIPTVTAMAGAFGISEYHGEMSAPDKGRIIDAIRSDGHTVLMVGDGINDAPALSKADVGVAMASAGGSVSSEAADVVILADSLSRVPELLEIGRRTKRIALQSIWTGLGLSAAGMAFAAVGSLTPLAGAALQEVVDVAVILNALRSSVAPRG